MKNVEAAEDFYLEAQEELDRKPYPTLEGFKIVIKYVAEQNPKAAAIKAEEIVDASWLKRLDDEKFFDRVYGEINNTNSPMSWKIIAGFGKTDRL